MFAYKIVMVGDFGVGKTSLVRRFVDNSFSEDYLSSIGVSISKKLINNSTMMLWDIEGKTELRPIFAQYLNGSKGFIVVGDMTREETIDSIAEHVALCEKTSPLAPICIALNKKDLVADSKYSKKRLQDLSKNVILVVETSAKDGNDVDEIFKKLDAKITANI